MQCKSQESRKWLYFLPYSYSAGLKENDVSDSVFKYEQICALE